MISLRKNRIPDNMMTAVTPLRLYAFTPLRCYAVTLHNGSNVPACRTVTVTRTSCPRSDRSTSIGSKLRFLHRREGEFQLKNSSSIKRRKLERHNVLTTTAMELFTASHGFAAS